MGRFLLGVFLAPVALGLLFTPLFLMDMGGLSFDGAKLGETVPGEGSVAAATRQFSALLNVFLYAYVPFPVNALTNEEFFFCYNPSTVRVAEVLHISNHFSGCFSSQANRSCM